jgi:hypothetical protein
VPGVAHGILETLEIFKNIFPPHCDLKVPRSQTKIDKSLAYNFLNFKANNKCYIGLKCK